MIECSFEFSATSASLTSHRQSGFTKLLFTLGKNTKHDLNYASPRSSSDLPRLTDGLQPEVIRDGRLPQREARLERTSKGDVPVLGPELGDSLFDLWSEVLDQTPAVSRYDIMSARRSHDLARIAWTDWIGQAAASPKAQMV